MKTDRETRERIATRIDSTARKFIEQLAEQRRAILAQVARCLLEDGVRAMTTNERAA